jgi:putative transcriptional regulator
MMVIQNRLKILIAQKELAEGRRLTYKVICGETRLSATTLTSYVTQNVNRFDASTLEALCAYFDCQPGDLLEYVPSDSDRAG